MTADCPTCQILKDLVIECWSRRTSTVYKREIYERALNMEIERRKDGLANSETRSV